MSPAAHRDSRAARKARRQAAADRRIGHDLAYWYEARPFILGLIVVAVALTVVWLAWTRIEHTTIATTLGAAGLLLMGAYVWWQIGSNNTQARMMALAAGRIRRTRPWHLTGCAGALLFAAAILILRSLA